MYPLGTWFVPGICGWLPCIKETMMKMMMMMMMVMIMIIIIIIIRTTGTISNSLRQYLSNIPGKHEIKELQKTAILGTAHTLQEVLL